MLIAGPNYGGSLADVTIPKLFIAGELDPWARDTQVVYNKAAEPKVLVLLEGNAIHGANLFYSSDRDEFLDLLLDFVNDLAHP